MVFVIVQDYKINLYIINYVPSECSYIFCYVIIRSAAYWLWLCVQPTVMAAVVCRALRGLCCVLQASSRTSSTRSSPTTLYGCASDSRSVVVAQQWPGRRLLSNGSIAVGLRFYNDISTNDRHFYIATAAYGHIFPIVLANESG